MDNVGWVSAVAFGGLALAVAVLSDGGDRPRSFEPEDGDPLPPSTDPSDQATLATDADLDRLDAKLAARGVTKISARDITANRVKRKRVYFMPPAKFAANLLDAAVLAQRAMDAWGKPLVVSTGYRPQDNPRSRHYKAQAIDLDLPKGQRTAANRDALYLVIARLYLDSRKSSRVGFGGLGFYTTPRGRFHVDTRPRPTYWTASIVEPYFKRARALVA